MKPEKMRGRDLKWYRSCEGRKEPGERTEGEMDRLKRDKIETRERNN
jgi:hypothetical protein